MRGQFITLKRLVFDDLMVKKALSSGAWFCRCRVTDIGILPDDTLAISFAKFTEFIQAKIVFIATGANVALPTRLELVTTLNPSAVVLHCYVRAPVALDRLIISYDRSIASGYAWIFLLGGDEFNLGCGIAYRRNRNEGTNLREVFRHFVQSFPTAAEIMRRADAKMPLQGAMLRCGWKGTCSKGSGSILLLGESTGTTFPFTGEAIDKAMETGEPAGKVNHKALESNDIEHLKISPERLEDGFEAQIPGLSNCRRLVLTPWLNDYVARRISRSQFLQETFAGLVNETIDPRKIFSLRGILRSFWR